MAYITVSTIHRALAILSFAVLLALLWKSISIDAKDPYRCRSLLTKGQWVDNPEGMYSDGKFQKWQPQGCLLHDYKAKDIKNCARHKRLVFVGDSTIRQVFWATAKKLNKDAAKSDMQKAERDNKHTDLAFSKEDVDLKFVWDPFVNSSRLHEELEVFKKGRVVGGHITQEKDAVAFLVGGGLWHARHTGEKALEEYKSAIDSVVSYSSHRGLMPPRLTEVNPPNLQNGSGNLLLLAPVQVPYYKKLSPSRAATILPEKISSMNDFLLEVSLRHGVEVLWSYPLMTWNQPAAYEESGLHVVENVAARQADVLLNMRCNGLSNVKEYPHDRTCCASYSVPNWQQIDGLLFALGILPSFILIAYLRHGRVQPGLNSGFQCNSFLASHQPVFALLVFSGALCYCYYADRTWLFEKISKVYSKKTFFTICGLALAAGTLSLRLSLSKAPPGCTKAKAIHQDQPFLSRDQTDEWKGWMQFVVLLYHYLGASKVLWIYQIVRLLVAAYLFMTGFGHAIYFYKTDDYSLRRVASVLIRLNLLACTLPYIMRTDYLFYYFAPLVSFWFVVVYTTMRLGHNHNNKAAFLCGKILLSALLTTLFIRVPGVLEGIFKFLSITCRIQWDVEEWRFRVFLDMFIVYVGMIVGIFFVQLTSKSPSLGNSRFTSLVRAYFLPLHILAVLSALIVLPGFWLLTRRSPDKYDYNWWQPWISALPILSFVVLRNSHRVLRNLHSSLFAWLGRCSLETFTLQFHIWLAGDTKGVLSLSLFSHTGDAVGHWVEFTVTTVIFFWTSWGVAAATNVLTSWLVNLNRKQSASTLSGSGHLRSNSEEILVLPSIRANGEPLVDSPGAVKKNRWVGTLVGGGYDDRLGVKITVMLMVMWVLNWTYP